MKLSTISTLSILATTATALTAISAPAQASTFLGIDVVEDSPVEGSAYVIPHATNTFLGDGLTYEFSVERPTHLGSRGKFFSDLGFMSEGKFTSLFTEGDKGGKSYDIAHSALTNDWYGSCNITINAPCTLEYTFEKGVAYQFGLLDRGSGGGTFNAKFRGFGVAQADSYTFAALSDQANPQEYITVEDPGYWFLGFEDTRFPRADGTLYYDFQDWVIKAKTPEAVPEPATVGALLGLGALGLVSRRRKAVK